MYTRANVKLRFQLGWFRSICLADSGSHCRFLKQDKFSISIGAPSLIAAILLDTKECHLEIVVWDIFAFFCHQSFACCKPKCNLISQQQEKVFNERKLSWRGPKVVVLQDWCWCPVPWGGKSNLYSLTIFKPNAIKYGVRILLGHSTNKKRTHTTAVL